MQCGCAIGGGYAVVSANIGRKGELKFSSAAPVPIIDLAARDDFGNLWYYSTVDLWPCWKSLGVCALTAF